jgi:hypothetical protein
MNAVSKPVGTLASPVFEKLERDGIAVLPSLLSPASLQRLQQAFDQALEHPQFNTWTGYEQNEKWRRLVENVLTLDPAAVQLAIHPLVKSVLDAYIGPEFALVEARGWETIATKTNFHGWHNDAWFHPSVTNTNPREVKLAIYLTDVESGFFSYIKGSHKERGAARHWSPAEVAAMEDRRENVKGPAGTAFLFDTAGIHCQSTPVLTKRNVIFFNYHDPAVPLQDIDVEYGRYRPLILNAGFLPPLSAEDKRILGFGSALGAEVGKAVVGRGVTRRYPMIHDTLRAAMKLRLEIQEMDRQRRRVTGKLARMLGSRAAR